MERAVRRIHLVATAIVGAQLVAWAVTGFGFTLFDFGAVRGTADRAPVPALDLGAVRVAPAEAVARAGADGAARSVRLKPFHGRPVYEVALADGDVLVDATDGARVAIDAPLASRVAAAAHRDPTTRARSVERRDDGDRAVFVVRLDDARETDVFVDAANGDVTAWRNETWRAFDALWSIHVLGYVDRRSPAHWALRVVGFVGLAAASSGAWLLLARALRRVRRRFRAARTRPENLPGARLPGVT